MNTFVSTTFIPDGRPLKDALILCQDHGIKSIEIGSNHCFEHSYDYINKFSFEYIVHNYFPIPENSFVLNIASFNSEVRQRSIEQIFKAIDFCQDYGANLYTFHPGFLTDPGGSNDSNLNYDFKWDEKQLKRANYGKAKELMYNALDRVIEYSRKQEVKLAIETEGSLTKKNHLLMQTPAEYEEFMSTYSYSDIGINLNIGHLNLSSKAFNFSRLEFAKLIKNYVVAIELSHNERIHDDHLPLKKNEWYWDIIKNPIFKDSYKILEFRNTNIREIVKNINYIEEIDSEI